MFMAMNDKQRTYTVEQIKKYNRKLSENERDKEGRYSILLISMAVAYVCFKGMPIVDLETLDSYLPKLEISIREYIGLFGGTFSIVTILRIIDSLCERAGLESVIANLEYNLGLDELGDGEPEKTNKL